MATTKTDKAVTDVAADTPLTAPAEAPKEVTPEQVFERDILRAEAMGAKLTQVVYPGTKGASPALRVDH